MFISGFCVFNINFECLQYSPYLRSFCKIFEVLWNFIFTEDSWATTSDFQQHFKHITCSVCNKSTQSQLTGCLGPAQGQARNQELRTCKKVPQGKISVFFAWKLYFKREIVPIDDHNQGIFFSRLGHFFPEFEKRQERPPSPSPTLYLRA